MSENQPKEYDSVLGGDSQVPVDGVVLGGIEGVKQRLSNPEIKVRIAGLYQALNYGNTGFDLIIQALRDDEREVKKAAYSILKEREETRVIQK
ncbi:MAG: formylglycine-generating enzyme family protein, partial [Cyanobacteria bacterium P01_A01_bin.68]